MSDKSHNRHQSEDYLPDGLDSFRQMQLSDDHLKEKFSANVELLKIRNKDYCWRVDNRGRFGWSIVILLFLQHFFIFIFIWVSYAHSALCDLQWLVGAFFTGLMAETFFTANYLVRWLFSEIPYSED